MVSPIERIQTQLTFIYGPDKGRQAWVLVKELLKDFKTQFPSQKESQLTHFDEKDAILITYADQFQQTGEAPLQTLQKFIDSHLRDMINCIHLLPFYPYSSDDGFSVIDYWQVDKKNGDWSDIEKLGAKYRLMFDAVINHISKESDWFQGFLKGDPKYKDYFITVEGDKDLSKIVRPRSLPLLHKYQAAMGERKVWTTFSEDQIDLNYANPEVLLSVIELLLFYILKGAKIIRLDAIAYLWKKIGTTSIHLPKTHAVVKLFRAIVDQVAPYTVLITETNVPHEDNISYFGHPIEGTGQFDEAHMVYQFPLAPLVLHTLLTGSSEKIHAWISSFKTPSSDTTFFNFIASHDGIGVMPARGLLMDEEIYELVNVTLNHGGQVSYKSNLDGSKSVYELNITLFDFLNGPNERKQKMAVQRFLASQAIMLALEGVPGIYIHSLIGSSNCQPCFEASEHARSLNREKFELDQIEGLLADENHTAHMILKGYRELLQARSSSPAFSPQAAQRVVKIAPELFSLLRENEQNNEVVLALTNITSQPQEIKISKIFKEKFGRNWNGAESLTQSQNFSSGQSNLVLLPYQTLWLKLH
jgi:sucrose phosphorylase